MDCSCISTFLCVSLRSPLQELETGLDSIGGSTGSSTSCEGGGEGGRGGGVGGAECEL